MYSKAQNFFENEKRQHRLYVATVCAFAFLIIEKFITSMTDITLTGGIKVDFSFGIKDLICMGVYFCVAALLLHGVTYKFILIPDSVLFAIKLHILIMSLINLFSVEKIGLLTELTLIETVTESFFFALFLTILFTGKLTSNARFKKICPFLCIAALAVCLPATVVFEGIKVFVEETYFHLPLSFTVLIFIRNLVNEMCLDLPYALLVILMFFVPQNKKRM